METAAHPILTTDRLVLRPYHGSDFDDAHSYAVMPEVSQFMDWGPNTVEATHGFLEHCIAASERPEERGYFFAITLRSDGRMIGGCDLGSAHRANRTTDMGYCLHPDFWGRGYATEAATAARGLAFGTLGLHQVTATCDPENIGSWRVMEKLGMRREGHEREADWFKGRWHDKLRYAILEQEWRAAREGT